MTGELQSESSVSLLRHMPSPYDRRSGRGFRKVQAL